MALLIELQVVNEGEGADEPTDLNKSSSTSLQSLAAGVVASTFVKVRATFIFKQRWFT